MKEKLAWILSNLSQSFLSFLERCQSCLEDTTEDNPVIARRPKWPNETFSSYHMNQRFWLEVEKYWNHQRPQQSLLELLILCEREPLSISLNLRVNDLKRSMEKERWLLENHPIQWGTTVPSVALISRLWSSSYCFAIRRLSISPLIGKTNSLFCPCRNPGLVQKLCLGQDEKLGWALPSRAVCLMTTSHNNMLELQGFLTAFIGV